MPPVSLVAVGRLDVDRVVAEVLEEDLAPDVVEPTASAHVEQGPAGADVPVGVGEVAETYPEPGGWPGTGEEGTCWRCMVW